MELIFSPKVNEMNNIYLVRKNFTGFEEKKKLQVS